MDSSAQPVSAGLSGLLHLLRSDEEGKASIFPWSKTPRKSSQTQDSPTGTVHEDSLRGIHSFSPLSNKSSTRLLRSNSYLSNAPETPARTIIPSSAPLGRRTSLFSKHKTSPGGSPRMTPDLSHSQSFSSLSRSSRQGTTAPMAPAAPPFNAPFPEERPPMLAPPRPAHRRTVSSISTVSTSSDASAATAVAGEANLNYLRASAAEGQLAPQVDPANPAVSQTTPQVLVTPITNIRRTSGSRVTQVHAPLSAPPGMIAC